MAKVLSKKEQEKRLKQKTKQIAKNIKEKERAKIKQAKSDIRKAERKLAKEPKDKEAKKLKRNAEKRLENATKRYNEANRTARERAEKQEAARQRRNERQRQKYWEDKFVENVSEGEIIYEHIQDALNEFNSSGEKPGHRYGDVTREFDAFMAAKPFEEAMQTFAEAGPEIITDFWISLHYVGSQNYTYEEVENAYAAFLRMIQARPLTLEQIKDIQDTETPDYSRLMSSKQASAFQSLFD